MQSAAGSQTPVNTDPPLLIASELFRTSRHPAGHPLAIPRVSLAIDLCRVLGWLPDDRYRESEPAAASEIARFHDPDYVAAVARAEQQQAMSEAESRRFNLGINGNLHLRRGVPPARHRLRRLAAGAPAKKDPRVRV